ncbi:MAG: SDR family NAD(P)-dependent oxidoreductase, partial [Candidatus Latescibacteria bacterium]|nr:SDR family NAD(P)-dependent oxidoreductase [Candidatus Latescibacterota bacterium]
MDLTGKVALVTGASSGIGRAAAFRLGRAGARVCVNSWDDEENTRNVINLLKENGCESFQYQADVSQEKDVEALVDAVLDTWGEIDILVNNAGISGAGTTFF